MHVVKLHQAVDGWHIGGLKGPAGKAGGPFRCCDLAVEVAPKAQRHPIPGFAVSHLDAPAYFSAWTISASGKQVAARPFLACQSPIERLRLVARQAVGAADIVASFSSPRCMAAMSDR